MAPQAGRDLRILQGDGGAPEVFATVAGLRSTRIAFNEETIEVTNQGSPNRWRELLAGGGVKSAEISGDGVFLDSASEEAVRAAFAAGTIGNWQVIAPDYGTWEGLFQITSIEYAGEYNGEVTYSLSLTSGGEITFTAAV